MRRHPISKHVLKLAPVALAAALLSACAITVQTTAISDDRTDRTVRPKGTAVIIGDSVGYGVVAVGGLWGRLGAEGWGPVRSFAVVGLHTAVEGPTDTNNVVTWIANLRAEGFQPSLAVIVSGASDVGYLGGGDPARNAQRIESALAAIGPVPVVWTTISHTDPALADAFNAGLADAATRHPNLKICDWAAQVAANPQYLERDRVHMTVGPSGGYVAMQDYIAGCVRATVR